MHNHNCGCQHDLRHCPCCDTVYCTRCGKEWKQQYIYWHTPTWTYTPTWTCDSGTTISSGTTGKFVTGTCDHS